MALRREDGVELSAGAGEHQVGVLEGDELAQFVGGGRRDLAELQARRRAPGDGVEQLRLAAAQLHGLEQVGVVDRQRRGAADRLDGGHGIDLEAAAPGVEQLSQPDHPTLRDQWHDELGFVPEPPQLRDVGVDALRVVE